MVSNSSVPDRFIWAVYQNGSHPRSVSPSHTPVIRHQSEELLFIHSFKMHVGEINDLSKCFSNSMVLKVGAGDAQRSVKPPFFFLVRVVEIASQLNQRDYLTLELDGLYPDLNNLNLISNDHF